MKQFALNAASIRTVLNMIVTHATIAARSVQPVHHQNTMMNVTDMMIETATDHCISRLRTTLAAMELATTHRTKIAFLARFIVYRITK